jgi:thioredoxin reductase (NADPH)
MIGESMGNKTRYDCIIIGAGPGGLQAAIHLARYNRRVLLVDRGGGRTSHARHLVNYLGIRNISGRELIATGLRQIKNFGADVAAATVTGIAKQELFTVRTTKNIYQSRFVIAASGAVDNQPRLQNLSRFFCNGYYTCMDCDGHHTTGKELLVMGNNLASARLALAMQQMYTDRVSLLLSDYSLPVDYVEVAEENNIPLFTGQPVELLGHEILAGVRLADGRRLECEAIMATFGWRLNDGYLRDLPLDRDGEEFKILASPSGQSSLPGLYVVGALRPGHSQAIIAAGQGAAAAIDINSQLLVL